MPATSVQDAIAFGFESGFFQRINGLTVLPRVQTALVLFQTTQPTIPIVECLQERTDPPGQRGLHLVDVKFPIFSPLLDDHQIQIGGPTRRLPQGTRLLARVTAPPTIYKYLNPRSSVASLWFSTLTRRATVTIHEIIVRVDGDPGGSGEMAFSLAIYDGDTGQRLTQPDFVSDSDAYDGKHIAVNRQHAIDGAPDSLVLYAYGIDWDTSDIPLPGQGIGRRGIAPPNGVPSSPSHGQDDYGQWADGLDTVNLPTFVTDSFSVTRQLDSIWGAVSFHVRYSVTARVESRFDAAIPRATRTQSLKALATAAGEVAGARTEAGDVHLVTTTTSGSLLYRRLAPAAWRGAQTEWQAAGCAPSEHLTVLAGPDDSIHVFSPDAEGAVHHRRWPADSEAAADQPWESLGGNVTGPVRTIAMDGSIEVFALGRDGSLQHRRIGDGGRARGRERWEDLGRSPGGIVDVIAGGGAVHVFVSDERGRVSHKHRASGRWLPSRRGWVNLGGGFGGPVVAAVDDEGGAAVVAFTESGELRYREWRDDRWDGDGTAWRRAELPSDEAQADQPGAGHSQSGAEAH